MGACTDLYTPPGVTGVDRFLGRYRRPVWEPLAAAYVAAWTTPGDLVVDPFCQDGAVVRAAALAGRRAVAITSNPLLALLVRVELAPPLAADLASALRQIRYAPKGDVALGEHLDQLYATACSRCGVRVPATALVWDRATAQPVLRDYTCLRCGHMAREPVPPEEVGDHLAHDAQRFHRRLVAERLRAGGGHPRLQERLLDLYTPRNIYALTSLLLKIELLFATSPLLQPLRAALLHTLDLASKLNLVTDEGWQPVHSLQPPRRFREVNVWRAFVAAVEQLAALPHGSGLALAATLDEAVGAAGGAVYVGVGPVGRLATRLQGRIGLAMSQLPRFDATFAALSYLWSGWLLAKQGSRAAVHLLSQRTREEAAYQRALRSVLSAVGPGLSAQGRLALVFQARATRYLEELLLAAGAAGLPLVHAWHGALDDRPAPALGAQQAEHHIVVGRPVAPRPLPGDWPEQVQALAARTATAVLRERAEPAPYTVLHGPIWAALARGGLLGPAAGDAGEFRRRLEAAVACGLEGSTDRLRPLPAAGGEEVTWWLAGPPPDAVPLADRVEQLVAEALHRGQPLAELALAQEIAHRFLPPQTPSWPLVVACLAAYGERVSPGHWTLAREEQAAGAEARRTHLLAALAGLGEQMGYAVHTAPAGRQLSLGCCAPGEGLTPDLEWLEGGLVTHSFLWREPAASADLPAMPPLAAGRRVLVIPERRVDLWRHKLAAAPQWADELERGGWTFLRQAALDRLVGLPADRERFAAALGLAEAGDQLSLFTT